ncbi:MAG: ParB/RepB/Spo0J family partition protein [Oscillospiraceae bacterium]|nr:ParB/RepB/Spo0J family partition protein [Oscillospiraceae bacterium]
MFKKKTINRVVTIPQESIDPNPNQPRKHFDQTELMGLAASIKENGILQPIIVRNDISSKGRYELISGERRLRASILAGLSEVPCIVMEKSERQSAVLALIENIQRQDLNYFEEAKAISSLISEWGITQEEAARKLGKAQSTLANKLRLLHLSESQRSKILEGGLTERHARALLKLSDTQLRDKTIYYIISKKLNVSQTEEHIEKILDESVEKPNQNTVTIVKDVRLFFNTINKAICTMQKAGVDAKAQKITADTHIDYIVRIPLSPK